MNAYRGIWRGKRVDNGEWYIGDLIRYHNGVAIFPQNDTEDVVNCRLQERIDPSTLGECVGFRDKNRVLMFEGDIVTYKSITGKTWVAKIIYSVNKCRFVQETSNGHTFEIARKYANCYEVVGNIHDNPDLIQKGAAE